MARVAMRPNPGRVKVSHGASIPAPIEGWDAVTPVAQMKPTRAVQLDNWFPQPGYIELRRGHKLHASTGAADAVETLMAYHAGSMANDRLFAAAGGDIFDVTVAETTPANVVTGLANGRWQHINFATTGGQYLWCCNGEDNPLAYDGSSWANPTIGGGIAGTDIAHVAAFKGRLWFVVKDSLDAAYLPVDSFQGDTEVFPLAGVFSKGGYLVAIATWALDGGDGPDDYIVFISSRGQVAIYTGSLPTGVSADFALQGVFDMGAPLGRRCVTRTAGDLAIICQDGVLPLSRALVTERAATTLAAITARIQPVMNQSARDYGANFGWQLTSYPRGTMAILNVPVVENGEAHQYVMNTVTGAWCRFLGQNASCWEVFHDRLFFGAASGNVFEADVAAIDTSGELVADVRTAFNYVGNRGRLKRFTMCRPLIVSDGVVTPAMAIDVDFASASAPVAPLIAHEPGALRTVTDWHSVNGIGFAASLHMQVRLH